MDTPLANSVMPTIEVAPERTWTVFRLSSEMHREAIVRAITDHFSKMETADIVWDLSEASLTALREGDIEAVMAAAKAQGAKRKDARTVFVCKSPSIFAAVSLYISKAAELSMTVDYAVFGTLEEAERWLTCNRKNRCGSGSQTPGYPTCPREACRSIRLFQAYRRYWGRI